VWQSLCWLLLALLGGVILIGEVVVFLFMECCGWTTSMLEMRYPAESLIFSNNLAMSGGAPCSTQTLPSRLQ
jgi:hypothetical protein